MAQITLSITGSTLGPDLSQTATILDADLAQVIAWAESTLMRVHGQQLAPPTMQQVFGAWVVWIAQLTAQQVRQFGTKQVAPPPIGIILS